MTQTAARRGVHAAGLWLPRKCFISLCCTQILLVLRFTETLYAMPKIQQICTKWRWCCEYII